ncbi:MAG TPA: TetR/AcrR family transcriptional regulator [Cellulomonas sp.]
MRADAARNRQTILDCARRLYSVQGLDVPMDAVARTAGVGVGTVYRHFPDRTALVRAVVADRLDRVSALLAAAGPGLAGDEPEHAWDTFFDGLLDSGLPMLMPLLVPHARDADIFTPELAEIRRRVIQTAVGVVSTAQRLGLLRADIGTPEIMLMFAAAMRAIPGLPTELNEALLLRRGPLLRAALRPGGTPLPGRRIDLADLEPLLGA